MIARAAWGVGILRTAGGVAVVLSVLLFGPAARGQGFLVGCGPLPRPWPIPRPHPRPVPPPASYEVEMLTIEARIEGSVARVQMSQTFRNTGSRTMEVSFMFPIPQGGAVDRMTFLVDGKELPGRLLRADEARRIFEEHIRRNRDPALLQWVGRQVFQTRVFPVPAGASRTVMLRYAQVCRQRFGLTELVLPLRTAGYTTRPIRKLSIRVRLQSDHSIQNIYSPSHAIDIERAGPQQGNIRWRGTDLVPQEDFRLLYDVGRGKVSAKVISYRAPVTDTGYFLALIAPELPQLSDDVQSKTLLFVLDRSGSMAGKKIEQAKRALRFVLNNLHEGDLFNIIAYDSEVEAFRPELQRYTAENRKAALGFVDGISSGGSTNIDAALKRVFGMVPDDAKRPTYVMFLTDGRPTAGVTRELKIARNAKAANRRRARLFCFGVGHDVNSRLLDRLANNNHGLVEYVRPDDDIEEAVSRLYRRIGMPALVDVSVRFERESDPGAHGPVTLQVYPREMPDLFAGDQVVLAGKYRRPGPVRVIVEGKLNAKPYRFEFPGELVAESPDTSDAYVEKLWAIRRIGFIIDEIDLHGENDELVEELVRLSKRHGILTPYTVFLADETLAWNDGRAEGRRARGLLRDLDQATGSGGFAQRRIKQGFKGARQAVPAADGAFDFGGMAQGVGGMQGPRTGVQMGGGAQQMGRPGTLPRGSRVTSFGAITLYWRGGRWIDRRLSTEEIKGARRIDKFGSEALRLAAADRDVARAIALEGPVLLKIGRGAVQFVEARDEAGKAERGGQ